MYNANHPEENELPSKKQLLISTLVALIVASILLITAVLPAEYGIDPTGIGKILGLTRMGEIKVQLSQEAEAEAEAEKENNTSQESAITAPVTQDSSDSAADTQTASEISEAVSIKSETTQLSLAPGAAAEVKVSMIEGDTVSYSWVVDTGHVNFDTHGDNPNIKYHNYNKGKAVEGDQGELKAAFNGKHGWFWRNRSQVTVTVTLTVSGDFGVMERVL